MDATSSTTPMYNPPTYSPCANYDSKPGQCPKRASQICTGCHLVSYCSKDCQLKHWKVHKTDCKDKFRGPYWKPSYITENRRPTFDNDKTTEEILHDEHDERRCRRFHLWGELPAMDVVRLSNNENDPTRDLNLAFLTAFDLRDIVETVISLPENYTGKLTIFMAEGLPIFIFRNAIILCILKEIKDATKAADMALHFWYSAFLPPEYHHAISNLIHDHREALGSGAPIPLGTHSELRVAFPDSAFTGFEQAMSRDPISAQNGYRNIRRNPIEDDATQTWYFHLRGSHRLACQKYLRFGIVQPFGAPTAPFTMANGTLFSLSTGEWLQSDMADPMSSYPMEKVVEATKGHGVPQDDLYGHLYFYLIDRLKEFKRRLDKFNISFKFAETVDATHLPCEIRHGDPDLVKIGLPPSISFDRIHLDGLCDHQSYGLAPMLGPWAWVLNESNKQSAILASFRRWTFEQLDGFVMTLDKESRAFKRAVESAVDAQAKWVQWVYFGAGLPIDQVEQCMSSIVRTCTAFHNTNQPFRRYLEKVNLAGILKETDLRVRDVNQVLPNRLGVLPGRPQDALPSFGKDTETGLYYAFRLDRQSVWTERFLEFTRPEAKYYELDSLN